jgi:hypothetical protein
MAASSEVKIDKRSSRICPLLGLPLVLWIPSKSTIMRWEVCNENEEKALQR